MSQAGSDTATRHIQPLPRGSETPNPPLSSGLKCDAPSLIAHASVPRTMTTEQFLEHRALSPQSTVLLPSNFFQSRQDIRTWGAEELTDPSVQPYDDKDPNLPRPFHVSLPGYSPRLCEHVLPKSGRAARDPLLGPDISIFPPTWVPYWRPDPNFKPQKYGYNWEESPSYKMDRLPYVNAEMEPTSAEATQMYNQCYPYTAYPYGVPRV